jgi:hypothetical protein
MAVQITKPDQDQLPVPPIVLLVEPDRRAGWFIARLEGGAGILARSHQPIADAARRLLDRGFAPATPITMRHTGKAFDSFAPLPIKVWASWTYKERDKGGLAIERWMPFAGPRSGQRTNPAGPAAVGAARTAFAPAAPAVHGTTSGGQS